MALRQTASPKTSIKLDVKTHTYMDERGIKYASVNKIIDKFTNRFDPDGMIAARVAKREGITVKEIKSRWQKIATDSTTRGTKIHKIMEDYINHDIMDREYKRLIENFEAIGFDGKLTTEVRMHNREKLIAGTPDIKEVKKGKTNIWDFKTNKAIEYSSPYGNRMKYFLDCFEDCNYNRYALQLSFYAWMSEQEGETIGRLGLLWINPENKITVIPTPYLRHSIEAMLNYIEENNIHIA